MRRRVRCLYVLLPKRPRRVHASSAVHAPSAIRAAAPMQAARSITARAQRSSPIASANNFLLERIFISPLYNCRNSADSSDDSSAKPLAYSSVPWAADRSPGFLCRLHLLVSQAPPHPPELRTNASNLLSTFVIFEHAQILDRFEILLFRARCASFARRQLRHPHTQRQQQRHRKRHTMGLAGTSQPSQPRRGSSAMRARIRASKPSEGSTSGTSSQHAPQLAEIFRALVARAAGGQVLFHLVPVRRIRPAIQIGDQIAWRLLHTS